MNFLIFEPETTYFSRRVQSYAGIVALVIASKPCGLRPQGGTIFGEAASSSFPGFVEGGRLELHLAVEREDWIPLALEYVVAQGFSPADVAVFWSQPATGSSVLRTMTMRARAWLARAERRIDAWKIDWAAIVRSLQAAGSVQASTASPPCGSSSSVAAALLVEILDELREVRANITVPSPWSRPYGPGLRRPAPRAATTDPQAGAFEDDDQDLPLGDY